VSPINPAPNGWLVTCDDCRYETFAVRRPAADRVMHAHLKTHNKENT
jgi:hypothetical protein